MVSNSILDTAIEVGEGQGSVAPPIAGRMRELADIEAVIDSARAGQYRVVLLSGEPGIGKTRLLTHAASHAVDHGLLVLRGRCYEDAEMAPYAPLVEVLRDLVRQRPDAIARLDRQYGLPALATLAPELATDDRGASITSFSEAEQRQRFFDAYGRLLVDVSASQPVVLILDDLHWADEPSALLLRHLSRALRHSSAAVLCAYRDSDLEQGDPFERVLIDLTREHLARRIVLRRLDSGATAEIVARVVESRSDRIATATIESIQRESEGVPFFVEELTLHLREEGLLRLATSGRWELARDAESLAPHSVRGVISRRLARLHPTTRELLAVASVAGREFGLAVLNDVAARRGIADEPAVGAALEESVARRLLIERGPAYVFAHEQIREVLYQGLSAIRRRQLHQLTAEAVERHHGGDLRLASRLAYHYSRGDDLGRALHFTVLAAADAARVHATSDALRSYDNALDILDMLGDVADGRQHFDVLLARDAILAGLGEHSVRSNGIDAMLSISERLGGPAQVRAHNRASAHALDTGNHDSSIDYARSALAHAGSHMPSTMDRLASLLTLGQALAGRTMGEPSPISRVQDRMRESALVYRSAFDLATELGETREQARIAQELGVLEWALLDDRSGEDAERARGWLLRALEGFRAAGDRKGEVTSLIALAYCRQIASTTQTSDPRDSYVSFLEEIRRLRATEHRLTRASERPRMEALALLSIDLYCRTNGWYEVALQRAGQALVLAGEARDARVALMARIALSETERLLGRIPRAIEHAERAMAAIDDLDRALPSVAHQRDAAIQSLSAGYALTGNVERALQAANDNVERALADGPPARLAEALAALSETAEIVDDRDLAGDAAQRALQVATGLTGSISWDIRAELVLARLALATGEANLALGHVSAASGRLAQRDLPLVSLQIAVGLARGQALQAAGFDDDARDALSSAHASVMRIAGRIVDPTLRSSYLSRSSPAREVMLAARRIGVIAADPIGVGATGTAPDVLTRREVEVVRLVAAGLPNREIADRLFISEKTVARHLTNVFTKLDVESRTQAAAWAFRQGIA